MTSKIFSWWQVSIQHKNMLKKDCYERGENWLETASKLRMGKKF